MNNENPEHLQENSDMPSQPDTGHVQADESELQATTDTVEPAVRDAPLHSNLFRAHHLLIILHRFSTKRVAFYA